LRLVEGTTAWRAVLAWRALHFVMRVVKKGNKNTKNIAYKSLVCPVLEYGDAR
jgi:hypothetical protein